MEVIEKVYFEGVEIEEVRNLNNKLNWQYHISFISKKLSSGRGVLCKLKKFLPKPILSKIYFSLAHRFLNYLPALWENADKILP